MKVINLVMVFKKHTSGYKATQWLANVDEYIIKICQICNKRQAQLMCLIIFSTRSFVRIIIKKRGLRKIS